MLPVHHPRLERKARLPTEARHAIEIAVGDELEAHRDEAVVDLPLALELHLVDVLLGQGVLHLPEAIVVQLCRVDMAADQFRRDTPCPARGRRRRRGWSSLSYRRERRCSCTWILRMTCAAHARWLRCAHRRALAAESVMPPHPANHDELDHENEQRRLHHRADGRGDHFWLDVEGVPDRETSPVATLAREPVPDREGDRHELSGRERGARGCAKGPLEDDRPFSLVVARDTSEIARVVGRDVRASLAGELKRIGAGQIEEPEIHRVLGVAEDEVGLAGARRHLRRNLDRDGVGELGWLGGWRRFRFGKGVSAAGGCACPAGVGATSASPKTLPSSRRRSPTALARGRGSRWLLLLLRRHGKRRPVLPRLLRAHVVPSNEEGDGVRVVDGLNGDARRGRMERASGLHDLPDDRKAGHRSGLRSSRPPSPDRSDPGRAWRRRGWNSRARCSPRERR